MISRRCEFCDTLRPLAGFDLPPGRTTSPQICRRCVRNGALARFAAQVRRCADRQNTIAPIIAKDIGISLSAYQRVLKAERPSRRHTYALIRAWLGRSENIPRKEVRS